MREVTAAIIRRNGKILICRRAEGSCAHLWEFPGGKPYTRTSRGTEYRDQAASRVLSQRLRRTFVCVYRGRDHFR